MPTLNLNTSLGQPSYEVRADLPLLHMQLTNETIDAYNLNDYYLDIRTSQIVCTLYLSDIDGMDIESRDVPAAQDRAETMSEQINSIIEQLDYPSGVIEIVMSSRDVTADTSSSPRVVISALTYRIRYQVDLDHPYYRLAYTLPDVPSAQFYS